MSQQGAVLRRSVCGLALVFACVQPLALHGDKSRHAPAIPHSASRATAPVGSFPTPSMRMSGVRPRLLAQTSVLQQANGSSRRAPVAVGGKGLRLASGSPNAPDDPTDPYITAQAAALNNDPNQIYAFVDTQIGFEAYRGSVRGARGTLWAGAGNTLDKASLLAALLQAAGYKTEYEHILMYETSAGDTAEVNLIRSMFPNTTVLLGCLPSGTPTDDPGYNGFANGDTNDYYWLRYGQASATIDLDPNLPNGQPGQSLAQITGQTPDTSFTTIPASLRQQVTIKVNAEQYSQASGLFGFGPSQTTVLTQTFDASALVGNIVSVGNIVQATGTGGLDLTATTFTYTPYLLIGSGGPDVSQDTIVTGTDYQELYTNFPLGSTVLTGLFVEVDAYSSWYQYQQDPYIHTMLDRIGPAGRQGNASVQVSLPSTPTPAVSDFDIASFNILTTRQLLSTFQTQQTRLNNAYNNYEAIKPAFQALPTTGALSAAQQAVAQQAATLAKYLAITENELTTMAYNGAEDQLIPQLERGYFVHVYPTAPRITVGGSSMDASGGAVYSLDVLKNDMRVINGLYQNRSAANYEEAARGMVMSVVEASVLSGVTGQSAIDIGTVMTTLGDPNQLIALGPSPTYTQPPDLSALSATTLSADAQALITNAVENGSSVLTPNQMVTINGVSTVGWWETDQFGHTVSHFPNGYHQAISEYANVNAFAIAYNKPIVRMIGNVEGAGIVGYAFAAGVLEGISTSSSFTGILKAGKAGAAGASNGSLGGDLGDYFENLNKILKKLGLPEADELGTTLIGEFDKGLEEGIKRMQDLLKSLLGTDPEVPDYLTTPVGAPPAGVTPGATPGVTINITTDPMYTIPFNGNELPVYDVNIVNTGPATDTFQLSSYDTAGQFSVGASVPHLTLAAGQAGKVNLCALPVYSAGVTVAPLGSTSTLNLTLTSLTSNAQTSATPVSYVVPALPSLALTADPQVLTVAPGGTVNATITLTSVGNANPGPVTLTAVADKGITMNGLPSAPVTIPASGAIAQPVSFTAAANATNNTYYVVITASYTAAGGTQNVNFSVAVTVQTLGTCSLSASATANQTGANSLGSTLANLANDMNAAAAAPNNPAFVSRVEADLQVVNNAMSDISYLQSFTASITAAGNAVASATPATLLSALTSLDAAICPVGTALSQASSYNTQISLSPNSLVTGPNLPAIFSLRLYNPSNTTKVYNLSVTGVPSGVTSQFSAPSVTLGPYPDQSANSYSITLTLTPGASFTAPFTFSVVATPVGAPEFAISAPGTLLVRPQSISIDTITATPAYGPPGTQFVITARVFAEVNQDSQIILAMQPYDSTGKAVTYGYNSPVINLSTTNTLQTVTIATIDSTNFANGPYTLTVIGETYCCTPIPGATAAGSFLVGAPLSGTLTANANSTPPGTVPPGNSAVQVALNITRDATPNPVSTLVGTVGVSGVARSMTLYQNGSQQLAYVASDSIVNIVDVTDPTNLQVVGTFAGDILTTEHGDSGDPPSGVVPGFQVAACAIYNGNFIISFDRFDGNTTPNPIPTHFATYSLADPLHPKLVGSVVDILRSDSAGLYVAGNTALMYQSTTFYNPYSNFIFQETGDIWAADLTNAGSTGAVSFLNDVFTCGGLNGSSVCNNVTNVPAATYVSGVCTPNGTTPIPNDQTRGGPYNIFLGTAVNGTTSYFGSTDANGGNIENPSCPQIHGQLLVVDTTTPASPAITSRVDAGPMTYMTGIAVQGATAVAVGDSTGIYDIKSGFVGTLVISSFDITNPTSPVLKNSVTTQLSDKAGSFIVSLGNNTFAVGNTTLNGKAELVLVDATDPTALRYVPYDAVLVANPTIAQNGYFFALSATPTATTNALSAFKLSTIVGPQLTVKLQLPPTSCNIMSFGFSLAPNNCTPGATSDTYEWDQPAPNTITFNVNVSVNPGDVPTVVFGGEMDYTLPSLGSGKYVLPQLTVLCQQILSIAPDGQNIQNAGNSATYTVTVSNPTSTMQTFVPSTLGIPASWGVQLPASVTLAPGTSQPFNLVLTTPLNAPPATYKFFVVVTAGGITASVADTLGIYYAPNSSSGNVGTNYVAYTGSINPSTITVGQNGSATFQVFITNTGTGAANIDVGYASGYSLPSGWQITWQPTYSPLVQPGSANTFTITGTLALPPASYNSTAAGMYTIPLQVQYYNEPSVNIPLTVNVIAAGATSQIQPASGTPQTNFNFYLYNVGNVTDTYNLTVEGPLSQVVTVQSPLGPIGAGRSEQIPITFNPGNFLAPGSYTLEIVAQGDPRIQTVATATVVISAAKGVSAAITPSSASVPTTPGSAALQFQTTNTGNVPDTYTATITGTTGPVTATLNGSGQTIASFPVPALGNSEFPLNAQLTGPGKATVTVSVTSLSDSTITGQATVTINNATPPPPVPVVNPSQANVPVHRLADLDASGSTDPSNLPLTFTWTVTPPVPPGSAVNSGSINLSNNAIAAFRPDVLGAYIFNVHVSNGTTSADTTVTYTAIDAIPVAVPGNPFNTAVGGFAFLHGANSYDPDGQPITFAWSLVSKPTGSNVTSASINNAQTPSPFFIPDIAGPYELQLIVTDATASSLPVTVTVTAYAGTVPPNADAGSDQNAVLHAAVTVNGSASADVNASPLALNYQWTLATVPAGSTASLSNATSVSAQFTPDVAGDYVASLVVSNAHGVSQTASITVHTFTGDVPPNANAGANQFTLPNGTVSLNSQASSDPDSGPLNLAFLWWLDSLPSGSTATMHNPLTATPTFVADQTGYYIGRVEANDGLKAGFANTLITSAAVCDADANGVINQTDIALIQAALGQTVLPHDPRDFNGDGVITSADVTGCQALIPGNTPTLQISPPSFTETLPQGSPAVKQTLQISSSGNPISFMVGSDQTWLTPSITAGSTASVSSMTATVDPTGLMPNTYQGMLTFTPTAGSVQTVGVTLTVTGTGPITGSPSPLTFTAVYLGAAPTAQTVTVTAVSGTVSFTVGSDSMWLTATSMGGSTPAQFNVIVTPGNMAVNTYTGNIILTSGAFTFKIPVTLNIVQPTLSETPPALTITASSCSSGTSLQTLTVLSNGGPLPYNAASNVPWLIVSPLAGNTGSSGVVTVTFNPALLPTPTTLPAGGVIAISSPGQTTVNVPVAVNYSASNGLSLSASVLNFQTVYGLNPASQTITANDSCGIFPVQINGDSTWMSVTQGSVSTPSQATVAINTAGLQPGTFTGHVIAYISGTPNITVQATVTLVIAPAALSSPTAYLNATVPGCTSTTSVSYNLSTTGGPITYTAQSNAAWLTPTSGQGTVPSGTTLTANINPIGMVPGSYVGFISVTQTGATPLLIQVKLTVGTDNLLTVSPTALSFTAPAGTKAAPQNLTIASACGTVPFAVQSAQPYLSGAPSSGQTPAQVAVTADASKLPAGNVAGTVIVSAASVTDNQVAVPVNFAVTASLGPPPPSAQAAPTQTSGPVHRLADLNASGSSDPSNLPLTFTWTLTSAPSGSALTSASINLAHSALASFRPDVLGAYVLNVLVSNGSTSSNASVTYTAVDEPPVAVAGNPFNTAVGGFAFLSGLNSYDPDGQPIAFAWTLLSKPPNSALTAASLNNAQTPQPFFTPDVAGPYQFQLIVTDASASSSPSTVTVTVYSGTVPPNANAGPDQNARLNAPVTLTGSASADPNKPPLPLNYQWTLRSVPLGSDANLSGANTVAVEFTPDKAGDYVVGLVVSNANGTSPTATATVHAFSGDVPPNSVSGNMQYVQPNGTVSLNGQASSDPDNGPLPLGFLWWLNSLPASSAAALSSPLTATPQFVANQPGYFIARLEANDGLLAGFSNTLIVSAATCDADANGVINQTDIALIQAALGQTALPNDPRDYNHDGVITEADVAGCAVLVPNLPFLQVSPATWTVALVQGSAAVTQPLQISSSGSPIHFTVSSNQSWLTGSISSGNTSSVSSLNAQVNPAGLTPATYQGSLTFTPDIGIVQTVGVTLTVAGTGPLTAAPASLTFTAAAQGAVPPPQTVYVTAVSGTVVYTAATDQAWLTAQIAGSITPSQVSVSAAPGNLAPGTYTGHVTLTSGANTFTIAVTFNLLPLAFSVKPAAIEFSSASCGSGVSAQTLQILSNGAPLTYNIVSNAAWLIVSPGQGDTGATPFVTVTFDPSKVPAGTTPTSGVLTVSSAGESPLTVPVSVTYTSGGGLSLGPGSLNFTTAYGSNPGSQTITAYGACGGIQVQIYADSPWISVSQQAAVTPAPATVSINAAGLARGTYTGNVIATPSGSVGTQVQATVTLVVQ